RQRARLPPSRPDGDPRRTPGGRRAVPPRPRAGDQHDGARGDRRGRLLFLTARGLPPRRDGSGRGRGVRGRRHHGVPAHGGGRGAGGDGPGPRRQGGAGTMTVSASPSGTGRVLVLTGAAGGIGREIARGFARAGSRLLLADLSAEALASLAEELETDGAEVVTVAGDVSTAAGNERIVQAASGRFGAIDDLVLGAGIYPTAPLTELTDEDWRACLAVNLDSAFYLLREALPH